MGQCGIYARWRLMGRLLYWCDYNLFSTRKCVPKRLLWSQYAPLLTWKGPGWVQEACGAEERERVRQSRAPPDSAALASGLQSPFHSPPRPHAPSCPRKLQQTNPWEHSGAGRGLELAPQSSFPSFILPQRASLHVQIRLRKPDCVSCCPTRLET